MLRDQKTASSVWACGPCLSSCLSEGCNLVTCGCQVQGGVSGCDLAVTQITHDD